MKIIAPLLATFAWFLSHEAHAQSPRLDEIIETQMRPGWQTNSGTHIAGVQMQLAQDWMTYWRHPGESGLVPQLDWSGSHNVAQARILWPEPRLYMKAGFASIGYSRDVLLPIEVTPSHPGQPVRFDATLSLGVCNDICIPVDLALKMDMTGAGKPDNAIATAIDSRPSTAHAAGLTSIDCTITPDKKGVRLTARFVMPISGAQEFMLIEMPGVPMRALPSERQGEVLTGHSVIRADAARAINRSELLFSVISERGMLYHHGCAVSD